MHWLLKAMDILHHSPTVDLSRNPFSRLRGVLPYNLNSSWRDKKTKEKPVSSSWHCFVAKLSMVHNFPSLSSLVLFSRACHRYNDHVLIEISIMSVSATTKWGLISTQVESEIYPRVSTCCRSTWGAGCRSDSNVTLVRYKSWQSAGLPIRLYVSGMARKKLSRDFWDLVYEGYQGYPPKVL